MEIIKINMIFVYKEKHLIVNLLRTELRSSRCRSRKARLINAPYEVDVKL